MYIWTWIGGHMLMEEGMKDGGKEGTEWKKRSDNCTGERDIYVLIKWWDMEMEMEMEMRILDFFLFFF
jgi:hypothetical protein